MTGGFVLISSFAVFVRRRNVVGGFKICFPGIIENISSAGLRRGTGLGDWFRAQAPPPPDYSEKQEVSDQTIITIAGLGSYRVCSAR